MTVLTPIGLSIVSVVFIISLIYNCIHPENRMLYNSRDFCNISDSESDSDSNQEKLD